MAETYSKEGSNLVASETKLWTRSYSYGMLLEQKKMFENDVVRSQAELARVNSLIVEADKLGLKPVAKEIL